MVLTLVEACMERAKQNQGEEEKMVAANTGMSSYGKVGLTLENRNVAEASCNYWN